MESIRHFPEFLFGVLGYGHESDLLSSVLALACPVSSSASATSASATSAPVLIRSFLRGNLGFAQRAVARMNDLSYSHGALRAWARVNHDLCLSFQMQRRRDVMNDEELVLTSGVMQPSMSLFEFVNSITALLACGQELMLFDLMRIHSMNANTVLPAQLPGCPGGDCARSRSILALALRYGADLGIFRDLLRSDDADLTARFALTSDTVLHAASLWDNVGPDVLLELLSHRSADLDVRNRHGQTPLHYACLAPDSVPTSTMIRKMRILCRAGADPTISDSDGNYPTELISWPRFASMTDEEKDAIGSIAGWHHR